MKVEILFPEVANLAGDSQNAVYLQQTLPDAEFIRTALLETPLFVSETPDLIYIGSMTERTQRRAVEKLRPYAARLRELIEGGTVILATGNAGEIFMKKIEYVAEKTEIEGLGILDLTAKADWFHRYNGKVLGTFEDMEIVGYRSQFSFVYGDVSAMPFVRVKRGIGYNPESKLEGLRYRNLFCSSLVGPLLPLNPLFCEYLVKLAGADVPAAFREEAMKAYEFRLQEYSDPETVFD